MIPHTGTTAARRGDVIRCTILFGNEVETVFGEVQVPVVFTVNGSRIVPEGDQTIRIEYSPDRKLYPYIAFNYENSVLAKVK